MILKQNNGYSEEQFRQIFSTSKCHLLKGQGPKQKMKFDQKTQRYINGEIDSLEVETYFEGLGVQNIKLPKTFKLTADLNDLSLIELIKPEACVIDREVYVRAKGIKEA